MVVESGVGVGHEVRPPTGIQSSLRDGVIVLLVYPALKDQAKLLPPLRGEEQLRGLECVLVKPPAIFPASVRNTRSCCVVCNFNGVGTAGTSKLISRHA